MNVFPQPSSKYEYHFCQLAPIRSLLDKRICCSFYVGCQSLAFIREQTVNMFVEITYFPMTEYKARAEPELLFDPSCIIYGGDGLIEALLESH